MEQHFASNLYIYPFAFSSESFISNSLFYRHKSQSFKGRAKRFAMRIQQLNLFSNNWSICFHRKCRSFQSSWIKFNHSGFCAFHCVIRRSHRFFQNIIMHSKFLNYYLTKIFPNYFLFYLFKEWQTNKRSYF